jgi:polygalacturonase
MSKLTVMPKWLLLIIVCFVVLPVSAVCGSVQAQKEVNVLSKGANGDGVFLNTKVLQKAIDELSGQGGGKLLFPEGIYHTGSLSLKPGITLHLQHGAVILGSVNIYDYLDGKTLRHLIDAEKQLFLSVLFNFRF